MKITRRNFVKTTTAAAVGAGALVSAGKLEAQRSLPGGDLFQIPPESTNDPLNYLSAKHFAIFVGTTMEAYAGRKRPVQVRLVDVSDVSLPANLKRGYAGESFSLVFETVGRSPLAPQTYTFDHPNLGAFSLAIFPFGQAPRQFEAVVNRIARQGFALY